MPPFRPYRSSPRLWRARFGRWLRSTIAMLILLAGAWYLWGQGSYEPVAPANGQSARATDGDSFNMPVGGEDIAVRIEGIDAPEYRQTCTRADGSPWPCGAEAYAALATLITESGLSCAISAEDRFNRRIARCRTERTPDIGAAMVARGLAIANGRGDFPPYWQEQERAEDARIGLWQGRFDRPAVWRQAHRR
jgi:endonuclease YncB( thermonuclease family)